MYVYAIRDRMLDFYMCPFPGNSDKEVLASVARLINSGESQDAIAKAPQHFEIWRLCEITETGEINVQRELLADAVSLVRSPSGESVARRSENPLQRSS